VTGRTKSKQSDGPCSKTPLDRINGGLALYGRSKKIRELGRGGLAVASDAARQNRQWTIHSRTWVWAINPLNPAREQLQSRLPLALDWIYSTVLYIDTRIRLNQSMKPIGSFLTSSSSCLLKRARVFYSQVASRKSQVPSLETNWMGPSCLWLQTGGQEILIPDSESYAVQCMTPIAGSACAPLPLSLIRFQMACSLVARALDNGNGNCVFIKLDNCVQSCKLQFVVRSRLG
jgi:hypothetical protein